MQSPPSSSWNRRIFSPHQTSVARSSPPFTPLLSIPFSLSSVRPSARSMEREFLAAGDPRKDPLPPFVCPLAATVRSSWLLLPEKVLQREDPLPPPSVPPSFPRAISLARGGGGVSGYFLSGDRSSQDTCPRTQWRWSKRTSFRSAKKVWHYIYAGSVHSSRLSIICAFRFVNWSVPEGGTDFYSLQSCPQARKGWWSIRSQRCLRLHRDKRRQPLPPPR